MHKYQPRIHIVKQEKSRDDKMNISLDQKISDRFSTHIFPETQFMAVTAYQNQQVSMLMSSQQAFRSGIGS